MHSCAVCVHRQICVPGGKVVGKVVPSLFLSQLKAGKRENCVRLMRAVDCSELRCWTLKNRKLPSFGSSESPGLVTEWQVILAPHREQDRTKTNQVVHLTTSRQVALCSHPLEQDRCVKFLGMEAGERAQWIKLSTDWEFRCPKPKSQERQATSNPTQGILETTGLPDEPVTWAHQGTPSRK